MSAEYSMFWKNRREYPPVIFNYRRRYIDLGKVLKFTSDAEKILDIGCGEGSLILMLREVSNIKEYYGFDLSVHFIKNLKKKWGDFPGLKTAEYNCGLGGKLPKVDLCVCMGVMLYMSDIEVEKMLSSVDATKFLCRVPCVLGKDRIEIDKFSKEFNDRYVATYRTISEYLNLLNKFFKVVSVERCYPDEIESEFGTKQFFFVCDRKST